MNPISRENLSNSIAQLLPNIVQGVHLDFLSKRSITHTQFFLLVAIHSYKRCPMSRLAENMHVSMPTVSGIVDRLVQAGYLQRVEDPNDRRQVVVELTRKGESLIAQFQLSVSRRWQEVLQFLDLKELKIFQAVIEKIKSGLQKEK